MNAFNGRQLAIWGLSLQFALVAGIAGTIVGVIRAFAPAATTSGTAQLSDVAPAISAALHWTMAGMLIASAGGLLLLIALFGSEFRARWFYGTMWMFGILWLINIPVGTLAGIVVIIYLVNHREEFTEGPHRSSSEESPQGEEE